MDLEEFLAREGRALPPPRRSGLVLSVKTQMRSASVMQSAITKPFRERSRATAGASQSGGLYSTAI